MHMRSINKEIDAYHKQHKLLTEEVLDKKKNHEMSDERTVEEYVKDLETRAQKYHNAILTQEQVFANAHSLKLAETFLEAAPQSVLQLYIYLHPQKCKSELQLFWITKSFLFLTHGAVKTFLTYPTKVKYNLIYVL